MRLEILRIRALNGVLVVGVEQASEVLHIVDVLGTATNATFWLLKVQQALRGLVMLGTDQLADLECRGQRCILLGVKCGLLSVTTAILIGYMADRSVLPKYSRCVHRFHQRSERVGLNSLVVIVSHICDWHASPSPFRCLVFPLCILELGSKF